MTPDTSPTALARLRERLDAQAGASLSYVPSLLREASAAILALEAQLQASEPGTEAAARNPRNAANMLVLCGEPEVVHLPGNEPTTRCRALIDGLIMQRRRATAAEARLLEIADAMDKAISEQRTLGAYYKVGVVSALHRIAAIARSKPAGGERKP